MARLKLITHRTELKGDSFIKTETSWNKDANVNGLKFRHPLRAIVYPMMCRVTGWTVIPPPHWRVVDSIGLPLRHLKASRACAPCPHKFDSSAFCGDIWYWLVSCGCQLILVINSCHPCVIWAIGTAEQLQVSGGIIPRPPTVESKRFPHDLSFSSVGRTGIHPIVYGWEVIFPSRSIYRLLECGTQAKAIFGSQSATCLLPLASQAGVAKHVVYFDASGGATDPNIPSFSV